MKVALRTLLPGVVAGLLAASAPAEVRVMPEGSCGATLELQPAGQRIWAPLGASRGLTLNPAGDITGDGWPGFDASGGALVAAWTRRTPGALEVALVSHDDARVLRASVESAAPVGTPVVREHGGGFLVAWGTLEGSPAVWSVPVGTTGVVGEPLAVAEGLLVDVAVAGDSLHVVAVDPECWSLEVTSVAMMVFPDDPVPITPITHRSFVSVMVIPDHPIPITPITHRSASSRILFPDDPFPTSPFAHAVPGAASPFLIPPCVVEAGDEATLTWRLDRGMSATLRLDQDGPVGELELTRGNRDERPGNRN
jgi:hypothetical protein